MDSSYYKKYEPIDGKWYITKELGRGAFGTVFEVERRDFTNAKSALKVISIPTSPSEVKSFREENFDMNEQSVTSYFYGFVEEFIKEFEVMLQLKGSNNIVNIEDYDVKKHTDEIGWDIFIRMELLTPMNLHFMNNAPTPDDVIKLGIDICKALEVCQMHNIVHRDIKPSNIFISATGEYKLGDFGVARTLEKTSSGLSKKGTYTYMAPEVFKNDAYGTNVDIYSLGIVMYKLLNKNMEPFRTERTHSDEEKALGLRINGTTPPPPSGASGKLAEIVLKACCYEPKDRYETPAQMREELEALLKENIPSSTETGEAKTDTDAMLNTDDDNTVGLFSHQTPIPPEGNDALSEPTEQNSEWAEAIANLTDAEIVQRCNSTDEWQEEYIALCHKEATRRNLDLNATFDISTNEVHELNYYELQSIINTLAELSPEELQQKKEYAEKLLNDPKISSQVRSAAETILYNCKAVQIQEANESSQTTNECGIETLNDALGDDSATIGIFGDIPNNTTFPEDERTHGIFDIAENKTETFGEQTTKAHQENMPSNAIIAIICIIIMLCILVICGWLNTF